MKLCTVVGTNIRKLRAVRELSQEELAHRAGIDRSYLSEIENGHKSVGVVVLDDIAAALEAEVIDLFKGYKRPKSRKSA
jgi:transcriptional regulator with XRE-family HTH domain